MLKSEETIRQDIALKIYLSTLKKSPHEHLDPYKFHQKLITACYKNADEFIKQGKGDKK